MADLLIQFDPHSAELRAFARWLYETEKNPLYLWEEYWSYRVRGDAIPNWILEYFDRVGNKLLNAAHDADVKATAAEALELKRPGKSGRGTAFTNYRTVPDWVQYAAEVEILVDGGVKPDAAIAEVANTPYSASYSTIWRAWKKLKLSKSRQLSETKVEIQ